MSQGREPAKSRSKRMRFGLTGRTERSGGSAARALFRKDGLLAVSVALRSLRRRGGAASRLAMAAVLAGAGLTPNSTESAVANGDTRTVVFSDRHTDESGSFTYMVNGVYDSAVLDKLNWFMRDWRLNEPTKMDPRLFDIIWEVYREFGFDPAGRRAFGLPFPADQRDAAPPLASGRPIFAAYGRQGDRRPFRRRQHGAHPRHRHAHAGRGRRILSERRDALGAYRQRIGALLAAHEPGRADAAVS